MIAQTGTGANITVRCLRENISMRLHSNLALMAAFLQRIKI
jgi:hypothetical protein